MNEIKNPYGLIPGDIVTAYNSGIHEILSIDETEDGKLNVKYNQVYSMEGKKVSINRPAICDISFCKPAFLKIPEIKERVDCLQELINYLKPLTTKFNGKL